MANSNFIVHNGLTVGPLTIFAGNGDIISTGNVTTTGTTTTFINEIVTGTEAIYGVLTANSGVASSSTTTGALIITGGAGVSGNINAGNVGATGLTGTLRTASQTAITGVGTLTAGAIGSGFTAIPSSALVSSTISGVALGGTLATLTIGTGLSGTSYNGSGAVTIATSAIPNTSLTNSTISGVALGGTLATLTIGTYLTGTSYNGSTGITIATNATNINTVSTIVARDASGNFAAGTITALATTANYADLAENYVGDAAIEPGTVVCFGGANEVTTCDADACSSVAGVVSTNPAYLMNSELAAEFVVAVAFTGRVPCKVTGTVAKGDLMVAAGNGRARAEANPKVGTVIGKALANSEGDAVIEVVVGVR